MESKSPLAVLRYPIMGIAFLALVIALLGGLKRMGYSTIPVPAHVSFQHGGLMVSAFLGTVISMERAVSLPVKGSLVVPFLCALGTIFLLVDGTAKIGSSLLVTSSLGLVILFTYILCLQPSLHNLVLLIGGLSWGIGNALWWWSIPVSTLVSWWMGFLLFVIVAERLELNRILRLSKFRRRLLVWGIVLTLAGILLETMLTHGLRPFGLGLLILSVWLIYNDMAGKMIWMEGKRCYTGWCLFTGYFWLGAGGLIALCYPRVNSGFLYDAFLHSVFVGFVFTMIFGHAFIIMPGVLEINPSYHRGFFLPLIFLEMTLMLRIAGDLTFDNFLRQIGGMGNALSIALFFGMMAETTIRQRLKTTADPQDH